MLDTTPLDTLNAHRMACLLGITAAERCAQEELLQPYRAAYERRAEHFRACLASVEAQIAALPKQTIYPEAARPRFRALVLARRAGHITRREFGLAAWRVRQ